MNIVVSTLSVKAGFQKEDTALSPSALGQQQPLSSLAGERLLSARSSQSSEAISNRYIDSCGTNPPRHNQIGEHRTQDHCL
jgi:hypothetical protein